MRTVGHRGASALAPGNTLLAVQLAISHGLDFVEVDVHLSRDRHLVVHHDAVIMDGNGDQVPITALSAAELSQVPKGSGQSVPRLEEVLELAGGRIGVYVELKALGTGNAMGALLAHRRTNPELIVGSFSTALVTEARDAAPNEPRSVMFADASIPTMIETCRSVDARYAHPCQRPVTAAAIRRLHAAGLWVMTPHTNEVAEAERFRDAGADLVASDDPRVLVALNATGPGTSDVAPGSMN
ncbi:MAG: glycerophosphodiester phosphodiesterase [Chloroflexota bacterium]|nr:glycerophosphodiester phosphodiesterase [Chloroflexota bacterium]